MAARRANAQLMGKQVMGKLLMGKRVMERLDALALCSETEGALTRRFLTPAHRAAMTQLEAWMREAGMSVRVDPIANLIGRLEGKRKGAPAIVLASHIDTVVDAGKYDGNFGVVAGLEAVAALAARGEKLDHALEVIAFGDEEGVRFPSHLLSSRALTGAVKPEMLDVADGEGVTVRQALTAFGLAPKSIAKAARGRSEIAAYIEAHIEQGPVLQAMKQPLAAVTAINGATRTRVVVKGVAGHAGTVPMRLRRDALAAAAEMALAIERIGSGADSDLVATVGRFDVPAGAPNVVPGEVRFTIDVRSPTDAIRKRAQGVIEREINAIARRRHVTAKAEIYYDMPATALDARIVDAISEAIAACGHEPIRLASGAGHDAMAIAPHWPAGMLFVRCKDGISHHPDEAITAQDAETTVAALVDLILRLDQSL